MVPTKSAINAIVAHVFVQRKNFEFLLSWIECKAPLTEVVIDTLKSFFKFMGMPPTIRAPLTSFDKFSVVDKPIGILVTQIV